jgi:hypothetical protein
MTIKIILRETGSDKRREFPIRSLEFDAERTVESVLYEVDTTRNAFMSRCHHTLK